MKVGIIDTACDPAGCLHFQILQLYTQGQALIQHSPALNRGAAWAGAITLILVSGA